MQALTEQSPAKFIKLFNIKCRAHPGKTIESSILIMKSSINFVELCSVNACIPNS